MRSLDLRHGISLRLALVDTHPEVTREIVVDDDLTLEQLRGVLRSVFDGFDCHHHLFTDNLDGGGWSRSRRRWGDRWTMIDFRDPSIIDAATARVGSVFSGHQPIYFTHSCHADWLVEIERGPDQAMPASGPRTRIIAGENRSPLACTRGSYEHSVLVAVLQDAEHPDHVALRTHLDAAVGPWGSFDPGAFDSDAAQRHLDAATATIPREEATEGVLSSLIHKLPRPARVGLRKHVAAAGLDLPVFVTADEAEQFTRPFRWLIQRAAQGGVPLTEGQADPAFVRECADALRWDDRQALNVITASRQMRLLYARNGTLLAKKSVVAATESPTTFWTGLAQAVASAGHADTTTRDLLFLTIADGTLPLGRAGMERIATARQLAMGRSRGHGRYLDYADPDYSDYSDYSAFRVDSDCAETCDCPRVDGATWHDIVAKSIRDATASAASDGALPVAASIDLDEFVTAGLRPEWVVAPRRPTPASDLIARGRTEGGQGTDVAGFMRAASKLIDLLSLFGLRGLDDGGWIVPPTLREFARCALQVSASRWHSDAF